MINYNRMINQQTYSNIISVLNESGLLERWALSILTIAEVVGFIKSQPGGTSTLLLPNVSKWV